MPGSIRTALLSTILTATLSNCCLTSALETAETTGTGITASTSGTGSTSSTGGTSSGGLSDSGCVGTATLTGDLAFPVQQVVFCTAANQNLSGVFISLFSDSQDAATSGFGGTCPVASTGTVISLDYGAARFGPTPLAPGTLDIYGTETDGGAMSFFDLDAATDATVAAPESGTVTYSLITPTQVAGSFDVLLQTSPGSSSELHGTFAASSCGYVNPGP